MAFAITNKLFPSPEATYIPANHKEIADITASQSNINTGIVGNKWIRVRIYVKSFGTLTAADVFTASIQVGTGASVTAPEDVAQVSRTVQTNDTTLNIDMQGASQAGFQSYNILIATSSSHSFTGDIMVDAG
jgi:hypothetical protein